MEAQIFQSGTSPEYLLIQPVDNQDLEGMERELQLIKEVTKKSFVHAAVKVDDWNTDLTPWKAAPVFGKLPFGDGARKTLQYMKKDLIPGSIREFGTLPIILGGYSLAGLFSLWCGYETAGFYGIAAASPSVWYPGFRDDTAGRKMQAEVVYLSLGDREAKTRNPIMRTVADEMQALYARCQEEVGDCNTTLEWNPGNHFVDAEIRMAKAFAWSMRRKYATR